MSWRKQFEVRQVDNGFQVRATDEEPGNNQDLVYETFDQVLTCFLEHFKEEHEFELEMEVKS